MPGEKSHRHHSEGGTSLQITFEVAKFLQYLFQNHGVGPGIFLSHREEGIRQKSNDSREQKLGSEKENIRISGGKSRCVTQKGARDFSIHKEREIPRGVGA